MLYCCSTAPLTHPIQKESFSHLEHTAYSIHIKYNDPLTFALHKIFIILLYDTFHFYDGIQLNGGLYNIHILTYIVYVCYSVVELTTQFGKWNDLNVLCCGYDFNVF